MKGLKYNISLFIILIALGVQAQDTSKTILKIGDETVSAEAFWNIYQKNNTNPSVDKKSLKEYMDLYAIFKLKVHEAKQLKKDSSASFKKELAGYREQLAKPYLTDENIHDQLILEAYERMQKAIRASHILIMCPQDALPADTLKAYQKISNIKNELQNGDISFAKAAVKYSDDRSARDMPSIQGRPPRQGNQGDLGFFTVFDMVYPFEVAAYNLSIGEISAPTRTRYGYHLIQKTDEIDAIGRAQVAHIYIKDMAIDSTRDEVAAKTKIEEAAKRIASGESFEDVVKTMSEDKGSISQGGVLPWFEANRMVPQFIKQIAEFDSIGQISEPIQTPFGWHIIKLTGLEPIKSFEESEQKLKDRLKKDVRSKQGKQAKIAQIKAAEGFDEFTEVLAPLADTLREDIADFAFVRFDATKYPTPLCKVGNATATVGDFLTFLRKYETKTLSREMLKKAIYKHYNNFTDEQCIAYENKQLEQKYPEFALLMEEYKDGILLFDLMDEMVWSKAVNDTAGYESYYQAHQKDYKWGTRVDVGIFTLLNTEIADSIQSLSRSGMADVDILNHIENDSLHQVKYERKSIEKGIMPEVDAMKWKAGKSQIFYAKSTKKPQYFIVVHEKLAPKYKVLEECRGKVISDYQKVLEDQWVTELRQKYAIEINEDLLEKLQKEGLK